MYKFHKCEKKVICLFWCLSPNHSPCKHKKLLPKTNNKKKTTVFPSLNKDSHQHNGNQAGQWPHTIGLMSGYRIGQLEKAAKTVHGNTPQPANVLLISYRPDVWWRFSPTSNHLAEIRKRGFPTPKFQGVGSWGGDWAEDSSIWSLLDPHWHTFIKLFSWTQNVSAHQPKHQ